MNDWLNSFRSGKGDKLQRLFSGFPGGWPGVGLLLLRNVVGVWMIFQGAMFIDSVGDKPYMAYTIGALAALSGVLLLFGFLTPVASAVAFAWSLGLSWLFFTTVGIYDAGPILRPGIVAIAIMLLGPGAFSVDCRLFGRRQIIIPQIQKSSRQQGLH
jgi:uncharacterized membrane protein YphA (DoxX/SURF4 family)